MGDKLSVFTTLTNLIQFHTGVNGFILKRSPEGLIAVACSVRGYVKCHGALWTLAGISAVIAR